MVIGGSGSEGPSRQSCCFSLKSLRRRRRRLARHKRSNSNLYADCHAVFFSSSWLAAKRLDTTNKKHWRPSWPVAVASIATSSLGTARKSCRPKPSPLTPKRSSSGKKTTSLWWPTRQSLLRLCRRHRRPRHCSCLSRDRRGKRREELESSYCCCFYLCLLEATANGRLFQQNKQPPKRSLPPPPLAPAKAATRSLSDDDNSSLRSWLEGLQQPLPFAA